MLSRDRSVLEHLNQQAVEKKPAAVGGAAVKSEHELVEIGLEAMVAYGVLVGAEQPGLQQGSHSVNARE